MASPFRSNGARKHKNYKKVALVNPITPGAGILPDLCLKIQVTARGAFLYPSGAPATLWLSSYGQPNPDFEKTQNGWKRFGLASKFFGKKNQVAHFCEPLEECKSWGHRDWKWGKLVSFEAISFKHRT